MQSLVIAVVSILVLNGPNSSKNAWNRPNELLPKEFLSNTPWINSLLINLTSLSSLEAWSKYDLFIQALYFIVILP